MHRGSLGHIPAFRVDMSAAVGDSGGIVVSNLHGIPHPFEATLTNNQPVLVVGIVLGSNDLNQIAVSPASNIVNAYGLQLR